MPKKNVATENAATAPVRAAKPKSIKTVVKVATSPRVRTAKHSAVQQSTAAAPMVVEINAQEQIAKIAYGHWEARGYQHGYSEQDWLRAEQEYLLTA